MAKQKLSLGESLVADGLITPEQLKAAQAEEKKSGRRLRKVLVSMGLISEEDLVSFLSHKSGIPRVELGNYLIDPSLIELVPEELAKKHEMIPLLKIGNRLTCAMVDPWNVFALDEVAMKTNLIVEPSVATEGEVKKALNDYYGAKGTIKEVIQSIGEDQASLLKEKAADLKALEGAVKEPALIKLVNLIIMKAIQEGASDIHIEPEEEELKVRFRVDGLLHDDDTAPPRYLHSSIVSRIKIMANLDIAETRVPQDGRFSLKADNRQIDVRVSSVPTIHGENIAMRILDVSRALLTLGQLGFSKAILEKFEKLIVRPHGIILVTGPTGSGKTTTLYASLDKINTPEKNVITIEDPVEYRLHGIRQMQVNPKVNLTFANGLRSILRQDPDVVMVGEIRDFDTAEIAIQAALTGHLVFSTIHTNDAASTIHRLIDMRVEPFLIASSLIGILAQRLVRTICAECKESYPLSADSGQLKELGLKMDSRDLKFFRGKGCPKCLKTGYRGRVGIYELLVPDQKIRELILAKAPLDDLKRYAAASGLVTLRQDGVEKIRQGVTTVEEVLRVTQEE